MWRLDVDARMSYLFFHRIVLYPQYNITIPTRYSYAHDWPKSIRHSESHYQTTVNGNNYYKSFYLIITRVYNIYTYVTNDVRVRDDVCTRSK